MHSDALYDACVRLKALSMKHYNSTQTNFNNTLHSSLYPSLFPASDLRVSDLISYGYL